MAKEESTLECLLTALWNVSGHSEENKKDICEYHGSLKFVVSLLVHNNPSIIENGGGILKNVSSYITVHKNLRQVLNSMNLNHRYMIKLIWFFSDTKRK